MMSRTHRAEHEPDGNTSSRMRREAAKSTPSRAARDKSVRIGNTRVGKGVFARRRYQADTIIGEIRGEVIDDANYFSSYCMDIGDGRVLEPDSPFRFVNHSCEPNCEFDWFDLVPEDGSEPVRHVYLIALREIKPEEELTIDYNWSAAGAIKCRCGAANCRGWIVDPSQLEWLQQQSASA